MACTPMPSQPSAACMIGFTTRVRTSEGFTPPIQVHAGVRQGCLISLLLFNLALEPAIRQIQSLKTGYNLFNHNIDVLAYADNIALLSSSAAGLQSMLASIAAWASISFNTHKCASLAIPGKRNTANTLTFTINDISIPRLSPSEYYKHLGVPTGYARSNTAAEVFDSILQDAEKLDTSRLAPWQKIDALNTFVLSRLPFHLTLGSTLKRTLDRVDKTTKKLVKKWMGHPQRASPEVAFLPYAQGGAGVMPTSAVSDIAQVNHVIHLFDSIDPTESSIAMGALRSVVEQRIKRPPSLTDLCQFLNSSLSDDLGYTDFSSTWTRLQMATRRLRKKINIEWMDTGSDTPSLVCNENVVKKKYCHRNLSRLLSFTFLESLLRKPDQGKVFHLTAGNPASNHFLSNGHYTRFADWRFVHRARLSVVPLQTLKRFGSGPKNCRRCGYAQETLAHVLCHCPPNFSTITKRHNAILNRLVRAFNQQDAQVFVNQCLSDYDVNCRPDLVILHNPTMTATVVDVATPFENGKNAFNLACQEKLQKYQHLVSHLRGKGYDTHISAFLVGALGGYDAENKATLRRLGIGKNYSRLMRKLMVSDAIRWSGEIYRQHLTGRRPS
ncbi:uncharacterized protein T26G10.4-like [Centruroides vittatus]|uniref:uncharacterized protein T26G10.4-like n=1 Tax=Centruroides vittatus TaxID=120091 RepID=UPI00350F7616